MQTARIGRPVNGKPQEGNFRPITRRESELTGLSRKYQVGNKGNKIIFEANGESLQRGSVTASRTLTKFWNKK